MREILLLSCLFYSASSFSWGCPEVGDTADLAKYWDISDHVFVGRVVKGEFLADRKSGEQYFYTVNIDSSLKGKKTGVVELVGDFTSSGLGLGENHVFFTKESSKLNACSIALRFEFHWAERYDIEEANLVRQIISLGKTKS